MKTIGIIGGMGPLAGVNMAEKIVKLTQASSDNGHIHVILDNNTQIPDRTKAILSGGEDPRPQIIASAKRLEVAGADFLVMACHTAHYFYPDICAALSVPILNMVETTISEVVRLGVRSAAVLSTDGTRRSRIYENPLRGAGLVTVIPSDAEQEIVTDLIYKGIKAGDSCYETGGFVSLLYDMENRGAEVFILACTELSVAFDRYSAALGVFNALDPVAQLASRAVTEAGALLRV